ncbi:hypothetical protein SAMN04489713_108234 [Actinomadura madurae]|uniref:Uncharacterized protein n=1 Tax=Actinomadura madurae TaxID=1993 RepID=A0A1I5J156_9ACTN|nr:hypothetical protein SAMN04489713_108234 [Actinomadura madurae]
MKRQIIHFDVRADTDEHPGQVAAQVGQALDCTFTEGEHLGWYAQLAYAFGLKLVLVGRAGIGGKKVIKLTSQLATGDFLRTPDGNARYEQDRVDISPYMTALLTLRTGRRWYQPTPEDRAAENKAASRFDDFLGGVGTNPWTTVEEEYYGD